MKSEEDAKPQSDVKDSGVKESFACPELSSEKSKPSSKLSKCELSSDDYNDEQQEPRRDYKEGRGYKKTRY